MWLLGGEFDKLQADIKPAGIIKSIMTFKSEIKNPPKRVERIG
jgi:hypothetical protein